MKLEPNAAAALGQRWDLLSTNARLASIRPDVRYPELDSSTIDCKQVALGRTWSATEVKSLGDSQGSDEVAFAKVNDGQGTMVAGLLDARPGLYLPPDRQLADGSTFGQLAARVCLQKFRDGSDSASFHDLLVAANQDVAALRDGLGIAPREHRFEGCSGALVRCSSGQAEIVYWGNPTVVLYTVRGFVSVYEGQMYWHDWGLGEKLKEVAASAAPEAGAVWEAFRPFLDSERERNCNSTMARGHTYGVLDGSPEFLGTVHHCHHSVGGVRAVAILSDGVVPPHYRGYSRGMFLALQAPLTDVPSLINQSRYAESQDPLRDLIGFREATGLVIQHRPQL